MRFTVTNKELESVLVYKAKFDRSTYRLEGTPVEECRCVRDTRELTEALKNLKPQPIEELNDKKGVVMNHGTVPIRVISQDKIVDKLNEIIKAINELRK